MFGQVVLLESLYFPPILNIFLAFLTLFKERERASRLTFSFVSSIYFLPLILISFPHTCLPTYLNFLIVIFLNSLLSCSYFISFLIFPPFLPSYLYTYTLLCLPSLPTSDKIELDCHLKIGDYQTSNWVYADVLFQKIIQKIISC